MWVFGWPVQSERERFGRERTVSPPNVAGCHSRLAPTRGEARARPSTNCFRLQKRCFYTNNRGYASFLAHQLRQALFTLAFAKSWRTRFPRKPRPVEKVVVGPVGSPKHSRTQAKTLQNRGFKPLNRGQKRSCGSFSTGCRALSTSVQYEKASSASQSPQHEASHGSVHQRLAGCTLTSLSSTLASLLRLS